MEGDHSLAFVYLQEQGRTREMRLRIADGFTSISLAFWNAIPAHHLRFQRGIADVPDLSFVQQLNTLLFAALHVFWIEVICSSA